MERQKKPSLLPYILDILSRQPHLCTTVDKLCKLIDEQVINEHISPFGTLKRAVEFSLEVGMNLGIITLTNERVRVPFNFREPLESENDKPKMPASMERKNKCLKEAQRTKKQNVTKKAQAATAASRVRTAMSDMPSTSKRVTPVLHNLASTPSRRRAVSKNTMAPKRSVLRGTAVRKPSSVKRRKVIGNVPCQGK